MKMLETGQKMLVGNDHVPHAGPQLAGGRQPRSQCPKWTKVLLLPLAGAPTVQKDQTDSVSNDHGRPVDLYRGWERPSSGCRKRPGLRCLSRPPTFAASKDHERNVSHDQRPFVDAGRQTADKGQGWHVRKRPWQECRCPPPCGWGRPRRWWRKRPSAYCLSQPTQRERKGQYQLASTG